jgi:hypothetical protein
MYGNMVSYYGAMIDNDEELRPVLLDWNPAGCNVPRGAMIEEVLEKTRMVEETYY